MVLYKSNQKSVNSQGNAVDISNNIQATVWVRYANFKTEIKFTATQNPEI